MGNFQISDQELKRPNKSSEDEENENTTEQPQPEKEPACGPTEKCEEDLVCELPLTPPAPDFCGLFGRAMAPFAPPPTTAINININFGGDPCEQEPCPCPQPDQKRQPQVVSFAGGKDEGNGSSSSIR